MVYEHSVAPGRDRPALRVVSQRWVREHILTAGDVAVVFDVSPDVVAGWVQAGYLSGIPQAAGDRRFHPSGVLAMHEGFIDGSPAAHVPEPTGSRKNKQDRSARHR